MPFPPPSFLPRILRKLAQHDLMRAVGEIREYKGKQQLYDQRKPETLEALRRNAIIQSVETSNRLEGITVPQQVLQEIIEKDKEPDQQYRSQGEIAGYKRVLAQIHASAEHIPCNNNHVLQLHRDLMKDVSRVEGGTWKKTSNTIIEKDAAGKRKMRFQPPPPLQTERRMETLHRVFDEEVQKGEIDPIILIALYILDFLCIHPFADGNGRMARLLTTLLLYRHGYKVCRYIALERIVEENQEGYYDTLHRCSVGWRQGKHDPHSWVSYWLEVMILKAYRELEEQIAKIESSYGVKKSTVILAIEGLPRRFAIAQLRRRCLFVGADTIRSVLAEQQREEKIRCLGKGRYALWEKISG